MKDITHIVPFNSSETSLMMNPILKFSSDFFFFQHCKKASAVIRLDYSVSLLWQLLCYTVYMCSIKLKWCYNNSLLIFLFIWHLFEQQALLIVSQLCRILHPACDTSGSLTSLSDVLWFVLFLSFHLICTNTPHAQPTTCKKDDYETNCSLFEHRRTPLN